MLCVKPQANTGYRRIRAYISGCFSIRHVAFRSFTNI
nr:MAG TPA: hypothetical protein [Caudoviricetes sp.]